MNHLLRGRYRLGEVTGAGAQGRVTRADDVRHGRTVAVKTRYGADETVLAEARVLYSLPPHPNLPLLREDFTEDGSVHLVMDWIDGVDLSATGPCDVPATVALLRPVADALDHMHASGIVHGDVKPANIVRAEDGGVFLVDLGLSGAGGGTPGYRAPEAASGRRSPAADVYSLAATAYAMLTGRKPRPGTFGPMPHVPADRADPVRRVIEWGLQILPGRRPPRASVLVEALDGVSSRHGLPHATERLDGRIDELGRLDHLVRTRRLVTVVGPAGSGKTRLAVEAGARLSRTWDGIVFVDARSLPVIDDPGDVLVMIDGAHADLDATADLCADLARRRPGLRLLVTSREPLGIPGEALVRLR